MTFIFIIIGLILGGGMGGFGGAVVGLFAGWACAAWIKAKDRASQEANRADTLESALDGVRKDLQALRERVDALEGRPRATEGAGAEPQGAATTPAFTPTMAPVIEERPFVPPPAEPSHVSAESVPATGPAMAAIADSAGLKESASALMQPAETAKVAPAAAVQGSIEAIHSSSAKEPSVSVAPALSPASASMEASEEATEAIPQGPGFIERLLEGNIVAKIGVVILFLGVGFLLKFAYDRGLFPPEMRLIAVAAAGVVMMFLGKRLLESNRTYAIILMGAAFGLFYLDTFFALKTFSLIGPAAGFGLFAVLGVATLLTAVRLDARALAAIGMLGAFMAPILASTQSGNHVLLFSYYLLLNLVILAASWFKAWRELNFIGFLFTFAISLLWGYSNYAPKHFATVEPFLIAYFVLYLAIPVLFASRQPPQLKGLVDGTLVFGMPLSVAMMQAALTRGMGDSVLAWSAAGASATYALMALLLWRRDKMRLLAEAHLALAIVFGTCAPYFAFHGYPTFAFWTLEGAAIFWMGCRQNRVLARLFAVALQVLAAGYFWWVVHDTIDFRSQHPWWNDRVVGGALIAASAWLTAWFVQRYRDTLREFERSMEWWALAWGGAWALYALAIGIGRQYEFALGRAPAALLLTSAAFIALDALGAWLAWARLRLLARAHLPLLLALAFYWALELTHPLQGLGAVAWPTAFVVLFFILHRQRAGHLETSPRWRDLSAWALLLALATWEVAWRHAQGQSGWVFGIGAAGLMASALRHVLHERGTPGEGASRAPQSFPALGARIPLAWSLGVWGLGLHGLIESNTAQVAQVAWHLVALAGTVALLESAGRLLDWRGMRRVQVLLTLGALLSIPLLGHPLREGQGWAWLAVFAVSWWALRRQERDGIAAAPAAQHVALADFGIFLLAWELVWRAEDAGLSITWQVSAVGAALAAGLALVRAGMFRARWPFTTHSAAFTKGTLMPGLVVAGFWTLVANAIADGHAQPWPYLPLINPVDLAQLAVFAVAYRAIELVSDDPQTRKPSFIALSVLVFWWVNAVILRSVHHWAEVPYELPAILHSVVAQAALSLLWTTTALVIMRAAVHRAHRGWWMCGAALLGLVVLKLALNDLSQSGTVARIVSFIGVGVLLLVIGYVAPVPPKPNAAPNSG